MDLRANTERFPTWLAMDDPKWNNRNENQKLTSGKKKATKRTALPNRNSTSIQATPKERKAEKKPAQWKKSPPLTKAKLRKVEQTTSPSPSLNSCEEHLSHTHPAFIPRPMTPLSAKAFRDRLNGLVDGFGSAEGKMLTLDLAMKALSQSIVSLSSSLNQSDPLFRRLEQLQRKKERVNRKIGLIGNYLSNHRQELTSLETQL